MSRRKAAAARAGVRRADPLARDRVVTKRAGTFHERFITGATSSKSYRCPGCQQLIAPATPHFVVWPEIPSLLESDGLNERRHWHQRCWERTA